MKKMVWIRFSEHADRAKGLLEPYGLRVNEKSWIQTVDLTSDDERLEPFTEGLRRLGISYTEMRYLAFDKKDLQAAEYLRMSGDAMWGYPQPEDGYESESYDSSTKCPKCGQGARQNRPFLSKSSPRFGKNDIVTMFWTYEFLVTQRLRELIDNAGMSGAEFLPLVRYRKGGSSQQIEGAYQLYIRNELPPMSARTRFETVDLSKGIEECPCGKLGRNLRGGQMVYGRDALRTAKDFNKTHEWLGGGYGTTQLKVVSSRVYELFEKNKIRGVVFEPVRVED